MRKLITTCPIDDASKEEIIWLAGLLEGEGSFSLSGKIGVGVGLGTSDKDVAERAGKLMGKEPTLDKSYSPLSRKPIWRVRVCGYRARRVMECILPWMGERRTAKIKELLALPNWGQSTPDSEWGWWKKKEMQVV